MFSFRSLRARLLLGHLFVIVIGAVTLAVAAAAAAPRILDFHVAVMRSHLPMDGPMTPPLNEALDAALVEVFRESLTQALLIGGLAALIAALAASALAARQVSVPVQRLASAARRFASGDYRDRAPASGTTELDTLTASFNDMAAALEEDERRRLQLIGDVAHELRTPISTLEGYLEGLQDGVVAPGQETWGLLLHESGRVRRLVEDLQELWRAEARQLPLELANLSPADVVHSAVALLSPDFIAKGLALAVAMPTDLPAVRVDRDRAIQVLTNLLTNALRYTPAPGEVEVSARSDGHTIRFQVRDTGIGLASEHLPHVFERFYRVDPSRSRSQGGSGVGLAIAKALVEAMGGRIWATSPGPDQGATFLFTLPTA